MSVTADAETKTFGTADPTFIATDAGFVNGDTAAALGGTLSFSRTLGDSVGSYLITRNYGGYTQTMPPLSGSSALNRCK